ncbi:MAG: hypothetical protein ABGZ23_14505 [Fuerstiella sp.]|nr:hypothetical protein [Fuerstiella sp.]
MAVAALPTERTTFTKDVLGRYVFNSLEEAAGGEFAPDEARPTTRPDARPFDVIVLGGGSFGPILAQHLFAADESHSRRVLVLEAGRFTLPEHQQNLPIIGDPDVWELPWQPKDTTGFKGLAVMVGGRSVLWGGWSPRLVDANGNTEMPSESWPQPLVDELKDANGHFDQAAGQIGSDQTNDFIYGQLHQGNRTSSRLVAV